jgi:uncharacterized protein YbbC (DUF1343 family)
LNKRIFSRLSIVLLSFLFLFTSHQLTAQTSNGRLVVGADVLISKDLNLIKGKRIGLVTNHTAILSNRVHLVDSLVKIAGVKITALFGPEHGIRGDAPAGEKVESGIDAKTKIKTFSLYGKNVEPTKEMLKDVDVLVFDIQDIGARFYTYISTLFHVLKAGARNNIPVIVLDRPNPIGGIYVDGPIRKEKLSSFVGIAPIPIAHGMTVGELANLFIGEGYLGDSLKPDLTVIKLENWDRTKYMDQYPLPWISPSPNIPNVETEIAYPGTCLIEGTNVTEGRGTLEPFLNIGAPFIVSSDLIKELEAQNISGVRLSSIVFSPIDIPGKVTNPKFKNQVCNGIQIHIANKSKFESVKFGIRLVSALHKLYPKELVMTNFFDKLTGDESIRTKISTNVPADDIIKSWETELNQFLTIRKKYLLY